MKHLLLFLLCAWTAIGSFAQTENWKDSIQIYISQARMLSADAYLKLADCYHKGLGVEHDFCMMMNMLWHADLYHEDGLVMRKYITSLPENDADRLTYEAMMKLDNRNTEEAKVIIDRLVETSPQAGKVLQAIYAIEENGDTASFYRLIKEGINDGYLLASITLAQRYSADRKEDAAAKVWESIAERAPMVYSFLGEYYKEKGDMQRSIECYRKADQWASLSSGGAEVLLEEMYRSVGKNRNKYERDRLRLIRDGLGG